MQGKSLIGCGFHFQLPFDLFMGGLYLFQPGWWSLNEAFKKVGNIKLFHSSKIYLCSNMPTLHVVPMPIYAVCRIYAVVFRRLVLSPSPWGCFSGLPKENIWSGILQQPISGHLKTASSQLALLPKKPLSFCKSQRTRLRNSLALFNNVHCPETISIDKYRHRTRISFHKFNYKKELYSFHFKM